MAARIGTLWKGSVPLMVQTAGQLLILVYFTPSKNAQYFFWALAYGLIQFGTI